ncbi:MAG: hypothetical protein GF331_20970 [Chitinivibrionales bacterium]|nr:hypothetical protein [Chitinivibrionales bacterium]
MRAVLTLASAVLILLHTDALCRDVYVAPLRDSVGVYANQTRELFERPVYRVGTETRLIVLAREDDKLKVRDAAGRTGWVENRLVKQVVTSAILRYGGSEVLGWLDTPSPIYIDVGTAPLQPPIHLERSFGDALRENEDRDTMERTAAAR